MAKLIEKGTNYAYTIERIKDITFTKLRSVVVDFTRRLPADLNSELYEAIQRGVCQLQSEPELNMYIHALGLMHEAKLQHAFEHLPSEFTDHDAIEIIDYGCGQAIGTICYADFLRKNGYAQEVRRITLIEPSEIALKRAALHASCFFPNAEIITINKGFDDLVVDDLCIDDEMPTLHIFSNVLDLADTYFNLEKFTSLINICSLGNNQYLCVGPFFDYSEQDEKLCSFIKLLDAKVYYSKIFSRGTFAEGYEWTCQVVICQNFKKYDYPKSYRNAIKILIANGAKRLYNCKIEDVLYSHKDGEIIVDFVLEDPIKDYIAEDVFELDYIPIKSKIISIPFDVVFRTIIEDEELGCICSYIVDCPEALKVILQGSAIDIIQQDLPYGAEYTNPFGHYPEKEEVSDHDMVINHCIKFRLCEAGHIKANKVADILLGLINNETIHICMELANNAYEEKKYNTAIKYYRLATKVNYAEAQFKLGLCYANGRSVPKNVVKAIEWYRLAAKQGHILAKYNLGVCYFNGDGVQKDYSEAAKWISDMAEQGNEDAQFKLGYCYEYTRNYIQAINWYHKAAKQGNVDAQFNLGLLYYNGQGVEQDYVEATMWYLKAAEQGYASAQNNLGVCLYNGTGIEQSYVEAVKWYEKSALQNNVTAMRNLAGCYQSGNGVIKDFKEALKWYRKAAELGDKYAQFKLANHYHKGEGVTQNDNEAIKWYIKAAEQGDKSAEDILSNLNNEIESIKHYYRRSHISGYGYSKEIDIITDNYINKHHKDKLDWITKVAQYGYSKAQHSLGMFYDEKGDYVEAIRWYLKAANQGHAGAQYSLGWLYQLGKSGRLGVKNDISEAVKWYRKAAEQGYKDAQYTLGLFYREGKKVTQNYDEAITWYIKCAEQGDSRAKDVLIRYESQYGYSIDWLTKVAERGYAAAQYRIGLLYENGDEISQSYAIAIDWYKKAIANGCIEAQTSLGVLYEQGKGVTQDYIEAVKWYRKAAEQGHITAKYHIGYCYEHGFGVDVNEDEAIKWYINVVKYGLEKIDREGLRYNEQLAKIKEYKIEDAKYRLLYRWQEKHEIDWLIKVAQYGYAEAQEELGHCYEIGCQVKKDYTIAAKWYQKAVEQNNNRAKYRLARLYALGKGLKKSTDKAKELVRYNYNWRDDDSYNIGIQLYYGKDVEQSYEDAVVWFQLAAESEHRPSQNMLGVCYENGHGVEQSYSKAIKWYREAAYEDNNAKYNLGNCYRYGRGVECSYLNAIRWYKKACKFVKHKESIQALEEIYRINIFYKIYAFFLD